MKSIKSLFVGSFFILMQNIIFAQANVDTFDIHEGTSIGVGPSHPASRLCGQIENAKNKFVQSANGDQSQLCQLSDGSIVNTMDLWYYLEVNARTLAFQLFLDEGVLDRDCDQLGGSLNTYTDLSDVSVSYDFCHFDDGSSIEVDTLNGGSHKYLELKKLILRK